FGLFILTPYLPVLTVYPYTTLFRSNSAYVAIHMYKGMPFNEYFATIENILRHYGGRPHWGKMHTCSYHELTDLYPKLQDFREIRHQFDPTGVFMNNYLRDLFNVT